MQLHKKTKANKNGRPTVMATVRVHVPDKTIVCGERIRFNVNGTLLALTNAGLSREQAAFFTSPQTTLEDIKARCDAVICFLFVFVRFVLLGRFVLVS